MTEDKNPAGRPLKFKTPEELQKAINKYFKGKKIVTMTGLARALGISRMSIVSYKRRDDYSEIILEAKSKIEEYWETQLLRRGAAFGVSFNLKNNFGWRDQLDIDSTQKHEHRFPKLTPEEAENARKAFDKEF